MIDIVILNRNLRLNDNAALLYGSLRSDYIVVYLYDENYWKANGKSLRQLKFSNDCLEELDNSLKNINSEIKYDIRFHLYPGLTATQTIGGNTLLIQINKNKALLFATNEKNLKVEKSIFFGGQKVLDNYCIVISGVMENNEKTVNWEIIKKL